MTQGGAAAPLTLGFGIKPLRGKEVKILPKNLYKKQKVSSFAVQRENGVREYLQTLRTLHS
jgi:hypothetical protein